VGSGRRRLSADSEELLFCLHREPERVGRSARRRVSQRIVNQIAWTRCGTEVFLGPLGGRGSRGPACERSARSRTRWVPVQNSNKKQPRCGRTVLEWREVQPKKNRLGWESLWRSFFVLIG